MAAKIMGNLHKRTKNAPMSPTAGSGAMDPTQGGFGSGMASKTRNASQTRNRDNGQMDAGHAFGFDLFKKTNK